MKSPRVVLVTGGTAGIGLETVKRFAAHGDHVFTCSRSNVDFSLLLTEERLSSMIDHQVIDVGDSDSLTGWIERIAQQTGQLDVLINNAAFVVRKPFEDFEHQELLDSLQINLLATLKSTQAAIPLLAESPGGVLINLSSMAAIDPFSGFTVYGACKAFIELFTRALSDELKDRKIRCYSIRAGAVETGLLRQVLPDFPADEAIAPQQVAELIFRVIEAPDLFPCGPPIEISAENVNSFPWNRS